MARMRYAAQALALIREADPDTAVTLNHIRYLAASGKIPVHQVGKARRLINVDALIEFLSCSEADPAAENYQSGNVRQVRERGARYACTASKK